MSNYLARELHLSRPGPYPYWALMLHAQDASYLQRGQADPEALLRIWSTNLSPFVSWGGSSPSPIFKDHPVSYDRTPSTCGPKNTKHVKNHPLPYD